MRIKKVNRYYCDFCNKGGCSAGAMKKHEKHCTMNPNRICRMCKLAGKQQVDMVDMLECLGELSEKFHGTYSIGFELSGDDKLDDLREMVHNCPICILAALRQKKVIVDISLFNYGEECEKFLNSFNKKECDY